jgi:hypothetical protein
MKRRWPILIAAIVALFCAWLLLATRGPREPVYKGRKYSEWVLDLSFQGHMSPTNTYEQSLAAVDAVGTNAWPWLLEQIAAKDGPANEFIFRLQSGIPGEPQLVQRAYFKRSVAVSAFQVSTNLCNQSGPIVPDLIRLTKDPDIDVRSMAFYVLFKINPPRQTLLPIMRAALQDTHKYSDLAAAYIVLSVPEEAESDGVYSVFPDATNTAWATELFLHSSFPMPSTNSPPSTPTNATANANH